MQGNLMYDNWHIVLMVKGYFLKHPWMWLGFKKEGCVVFAVVPYDWSLTFFLYCYNTNLQKVWPLWAMTSVYCHLNHWNVFKIFVARIPWVSSSGLELVVRALFVEKKEEADVQVFLMKVEGQLFLGIVLFLFALISAKLEERGWRSCDRQTNNLQSYNERFLVGICQWSDH